MSTLVLVSALGFICLLLEILNLRKVLVPVTTLGLLGVLGITAYEYVTGDLLIDNDSHNMIVSTGFSQGFSMLFIILSILIIGMCPTFYKDKIDKIADYVSLKIFLLAGAVAMVSFGNLVMFFIGLEVLSIAGYVLAGSNPTNIKSNEAGLKYFIMGAFASGFIVFGIALLYGVTGSLDINEMFNVLLSKRLPLVPFPLYDVGLIMVFIGLLFKVSVFPFHFWAPDVYEGSPNVVTALMSTLVKVAAVATLCKVAGDLIIYVSKPWETIIIIISILSMTVANITALVQTNIKRMMAFSGISHAGFMIMALLCLDGPSHSNAVLYYAAAYSLAAIAVFASVMIVSQRTGSEDISSFNGLAKKHPILAIVVTLALLSLAGIPILGGFFAKLFMFSDMLKANHLALVIVGVINSIISLYYYMRVMNAMFLKEETSNETDMMSIPFEYKIVAYVAIALNILIGICPNIIMNMQL